MGDWNYRGERYCSVSELIGLTLRAVERDGDDELRFIATDGRKFRMWHQQDCCEGVGIADLNGDLADLVGSPILVAEESESNEWPADVEEPKYRDSFTWTFYRIATQKGFVTVRWLGESNGYYSESVDFAEVRDK